MSSLAVTTRRIINYSCAPWVSYSSFLYSSIFKFHFLHMGIEIATLLGYISQMGGNSKINGSRACGWGHVSRGAKSRNYSYHSRDDIGIWRGRIGWAKSGFGCPHQGRKTCDQCRWHGWLCLINSFRNFCSWQNIPIFQRQFVLTFFAPMGNMHPKKVIGLLWWQFVEDSPKTFKKNRAYFRELVWQMILD